MEKVFPIRIDDTLHRRMKHAAIDAGMTLHAWIVRVLEEHACCDGSASTKRPRKSDESQGSRD
jgi:hypothetical protein